jgi:3-methylcrotonyl-CoA carboxylase alpha subunit
MFTKILIANRGEIACRVIRTARRLGIRTVAVYSSADAQALHVAMADEARLIGDAPSSASYLSIPRILEAARASGAQAIHPGYGFLSENADFAQACADAGIVFIGPSAAAIRAIGDKAHAKAVMERAGVPIVPGYHGAAQDETRFATEAARIGYPVLIKASAGGGGRGMRVVTAPDELADALAAARREAIAGFGDGTLILERYLERPRHVEVQVFGDSHGHIVHLFERDCSAQRRHQKVIEESPAPGLSAKLREALGAAAITAARAVDYVGAGTVEFILQADQFHFIEMNTRLQVEHPVTEMVTGFDLVEWQLRVAAGEDLPAAQEQIVSRGHAIEARLYAEDPAHDFVPASGRLQRFRLPDAADDLRIETGLREGDEIPIFYDALIAKIIASGADRETARTRLASALAATEIAGLVSNRDFLLRLLRRPEFTAGAVDTGFIVRHGAALATPLSAAPLGVLAAASLALIYGTGSTAADVGSATPDSHSPWTLRDGWRLGAAAPSPYEIVWHDGQLERRLTIGFQASNFSLTLDGDTAEVKLTSRDENEVSFLLDGAPLQAEVRRQGNSFALTLAGQSFRLLHRDAFSASAGAELGRPRLAAPVHGRVLDVLVSAGDAVKRGQVLMLLECMKLEYRVTAPADGTVAAVNFEPGDVVGDGVELIVFEPKGA